MTLDELLKATARTLYLSAKIMPSKTRKAFCCGYLLCRAADSIADTGLIEAGLRLRLIKDYPRIIQTQDAKLLSAFFAAVPRGAKMHAAEQTLLNNIDICLKAYNALPPAHRDMILDVAGAVCSAMERDLSYFPAENYRLIKALPDAAQTIAYCDEMGGEPGAFWARLLLDGKKNDDFINNGRAVGRALQITNILRDLPADAAIGRCYLPLTDLTAQNLLPQDLLNKKNYKKLRPVIFKWINFGVENISAAPDFMAKIPRMQLGARAAVAWPVLWSLDTLLLLAKAKNLLDKKRRVRISKTTIWLTIFLSPLFCCSNFIFRLLVNYKAGKVKKIIKTAPRGLSIPQS
ncbi:MAG: squalene/phytoene synthase family protein [Elusimicrobiota bacterium]|jgi:farnesyl-diphosphate farnesyltransferase|nr:squalene/phytoene synthase family protein [Elusimicrobiota bacterium]